MRGQQETAKTLRVGELGVTLALWAVAVYLAKQRFGALAGFDLQPIVAAGHAVLHAQAVYRSVPLFVYPPFTAVLFAPLAAVSFHTASGIYSVLQVVAPSAGLTLIAHRLTPRHWMLVSGVAVCVLVRSDVFAQGYFLDNPSFLFTFPLALAACCFGSGRWGWGAAVIGVSVAVKPFFIFVLLLPLVRRQYRAFGIGVGVTLGLTAIGVLLSHDVSGVAHLPRRIFTGTTLHGALQANNVSLASVGVVHHVQWLMYPLRTLIVVVVAGVAWRCRFSRLPLPRALFLTTAVALATALCGSIDENHYGLLALPACLALVMGSGGRIAQLLGIAATVILCFPLYKIHVALTASEGQIRWATGQSLVLLACLIASVRRLPSETATLPADT